MTKEFVRPAESRGLWHFEYIGRPVVLFDQRDPCCVSPAALEEARIKYNTEQANKPKPDYAENV